MFSMHRACTMRMAIIAAGSAEPESVSNIYGSPYRTDSPTNPYGEGLSIYGDDDG
jgi:hypothetical protein